MSLSTKERQLLRDVFRWARANGWERHRTAHRIKGLFDWEEQDQSGYGVMLSAADEVVSGGTLNVQRPGGWLEMWATDVRQAVDVLAALGILPVTFSSAYQAGANLVTPCPDTFKRHWDGRKFVCARTDHANDDPLHMWRPADGLPR